MALACARDLAVMCFEQKKYDEAEAHWRAAAAKMALPERPAAHAPACAADADAATELSLCIGDALRMQGKLTEARALAEAAVAEREARLGPDHPWTLGAVYDLAHLLRCQKLNETGVSPFSTGEPSATAGSRNAEVARRVRAAMAMAAAATTELDERWMGGLRALCEGEPPIRWAEQVAQPRPQHTHSAPRTLPFSSYPRPTPHGAPQDESLPTPSPAVRQVASLASTAQAHREDAEALLLMERALPTYEATYGENSIDLAELLNTIGESQMELRLLEEVGDARRRPPRAGRFCPPGG